MGLHYKGSWAVSFFMTLVDIFYSESTVIFIAFGLLNWVAYRSPPEDQQSNAPCFVYVPSPALPITSLTRYTVPADSVTRAQHTVDPIIHLEWITLNNVRILSRSELRLSHNWFLFSSNTYMKLHVIRVSSTSGDACCTFPVHHRKQSLGLWSRSLPTSKAKTLYSWLFT